MIATGICLLFLDYLDSSGENGHETTDHSHSIGVTNPSPTQSDRRPVSVTSFFSCVASPPTFMFVWFIEISNRFVCKVQVDVFAAVSNVESRTRRVVVTLE